MTTDQNDLRQAVARAIAKEAFLRSQNSGYIGYSETFDDDWIASEHYEAADAALAEMGEAKAAVDPILPEPVSVREAALKAQIHRLTAAGDNLTAWVDDRGTPDVHKWDKARDEAFRAIAEGKET